LFTSPSICCSMWSIAALSMAASGELHEKLTVT
jgi:hypothetical protein